MFLHSSRPAAALLAALIGGISSSLPCSQAVTVVASQLALNTSSSTLTRMAAPPAGESTCGLSGAVPSCQSSADMGSCGNACCAIEVAVKQTSTALYTSLKSFLMSGGPEKAFGHVTSTAENFTENFTGWEKDFHFALQGTHTTSGRHYVDTLNFLIGAESLTAQSSKLRAFSISNLHGALGDAGQNAQTLVYLLEALGVGGHLKVLYGCGGLESQLPALIQLDQGKEGDHSQRERIQRQGLPPPVALNGSSCGMDDNAHPIDCDFDLTANFANAGRCGNQCCALEAGVAMSPEELYSMLVAFLDTGGDNNSFKHVNGTMPFNEHPPENLTSLGMEWKYIVQAKHTSNFFVDTLNFNIRSEPHDGAAWSVLRGFSMSDQPSVVGDAGQSLKSLLYTLDALGVNRTHIDVLYGCHGGARSCGMGPLAAMVFAGIFMSAGTFW